MSCRKHRLQLLDCFAYGSTTNDALSRGLSGQMACNKEEIWLEDPSDSEWVWSTLKDTQTCKSCGQCRGHRVEEAAAYQIKHLVWQRVEAAIAAGGGQGQVKLEDIKREDPADPEIPADLLCPICLDSIVTPVQGGCKHSFCRGCILQHMVTSVKDRSRKMGACPSCPLCRAPLPSAPSLKLCLGLQRRLQAAWSQADQPRLLAARRREDALEKELAAEEQRYDREGEEPPLVVPEQHHRVASNLRSCGLFLFVALLLWSMDFSDLGHIRGQRQRHGGSGRTLGSSSFFSGDCAV
ncbi:unnamed protein product [Chrysoparadoxa australica]